MPATAWLRSHRLEAVWGLLVTGAVTAIVVWPSWKTVPFHLVWVSLTLAYAFHTRSRGVTIAALAVAIVGSGASVFAHTLAGLSLRGVVEAVLLCAMFAVVAWNLRETPRRVRDAGTAWMLGRRRPGLGHYRVEALWAAFAVANVGAMVAWPSWETIPFHFLWISLTLVYGFRVWSTRVTALVLGLVIASTGASIFADAFNGIQLWGELFEVPLMSAMFLAMVWHARRRQDAIREAEELAESRASLLLRQERFLHDVSHELRTPVTIARGHLELLRREHGVSPELAIAIDELGRIDRIIARLLLLAKAERPDFLAARRVELEPFLEDVFIRWADVSERAWRLGEIACGWLWADEEALRTALDALLENAVKYTETREPIELAAFAAGGELVIEVADGGCGVPPEALGRIFDRFGRADDARTRTQGGVGLGLAIVDAIARAHGGHCTVTPLERGTVFALRLPGFQTAAARPAPRAAPGEPDATRQVWPASA